jgi:hypothetical protein
MEENNLRKSLIFNKDEYDIKYQTALNKQFDYEKNTLPDSPKYIIDKFPDELVDPFYKCEPVKCYKRNWIKTLVSKKKIRLINQDFDLDLVYIYLI